MEKTSSAEKPINNILMNLLIIPPFVTGIISGIATIGTGAFILYTSLKENFENYRLGVTLIIIGVLSCFLISEKIRPGKYLMTSEKITIFSAIWFLITMYATENLDISSYLIVILIGLLVISELFRAKASKGLEIKLKIMVLIFFLVNLGLIINLIIPYLTGK